MNARGRCEDCWADVYEGREEHRRGPAPRFCGPCRTRRRRESRLATENRRRALQGLPPADLVTCRVCGQEFRSGATRRETCSADCRRAAEAAEAEERAAVEAARWKACADCGKALRPLEPNPRKREWLCPMCEARRQDRADAAALRPQRRCPCGCGLTVQDTYGRGRPRKYAVPSRCRKRAQRAASRLTDIRDLPNTVAPATQPLEVPCPR